MRWYPHDVIPFVIEVNLPATNSSFSMSPSSVFWNLSENGFVKVSAPSDCFNLALKFDASISDTTLKGEFEQPTFANFSGELAANGQSITTGTYSGGFCSDSGYYGLKVNGAIT